MELWRKITSRGSKDNLLQEIIAYNNRLEQEYARNHIDDTGLSADTFLQAMQEKYTLPDQTAYLKTFHELLRYNTYIDLFQSVLYNEEFIPKITIAGMHLSMNEAAIPEMVISFDRDIANTFISDLNLLKFYANLRQDTFHRLSKKNLPDYSASVKLSKLIKGIDMFFSKESPKIDLYGLVYAQDFIDASVNVMSGCEGMGINPLVGITMANIWKRDVFRGTPK